MYIKGQLCYLEIGVPAVSSRSLFHLLVDYAG